MLTWPANFPHQSDQPLLEPPQSPGQCWSRDCPEPLSLHWSTKTQSGSSSSLEPWNLGTLPGTASCIAMFVLLPAPAAISSSFSHSSRTFLLSRVTLGPSRTVTTSPGGVNTTSGQAGVGDFLSLTCCYEKPHWLGNRNRNRKLV